MEKIKHMQDELSPKRERSWLEKLSIALLREPQDREQLINLLRDAKQRNLLNADTLSMIESMLQIPDMQVQDIMIPRSHVIMIKENESLEKILKIVIESAHSRYPVIGYNRDEVIGVLLAKDLLRFHDKENKQFSLSDIIRPVLFIPESKRLDVLLKEFRKNRNHMAIVVDEYGGVAGVVTIEDVLEQIVGEIEDEFDIDEESYIKKHDNGKFIIKAITPIEEFNQFFGSHFSQEEFDTIGGFVTNVLGRLPKRGEMIHIHNYQFEVLNADNRRIKLLKLTLGPTTEKNTV
jgi:magnesium and cobalt transporter